MLEWASRFVGRISQAIHVFALALIGLIMTGIGLVLAIGARPEAVIPLLLGAASIFHLRKRFADLFRGAGNF